MSSNYSFLRSRFGGDDIRGKGGDVSIQSRYDDALRSLPPSGGGGLHTALLGVANLGVMAGLTDAEILSDIRAHIHGKRQVPDGEIRAAIARARMDTEPGQKCPTAGRPYQAKPTPAEKYSFTARGKRTLAKVIARAEGAGLAEIHDSSPISLSSECGPEDSAMLFDCVYAPDDRVFCGNQTDAGIDGLTIKRAGEWAQTWRSGYSVPPLVILNPLDGYRKPLKGNPGKLTRRGDGCVAQFKFMLLEFDGIPIEEQAAFLIGAKLPTWAIIHSGGKSLHAWIDTLSFFGETITTLERWDDLVGTQAKPIIQAIGADPACCTASRLGRLPGHYRTEKKSWQRLLWLSDKPREVLP